MSQDTITDRRDCPRFFLTPSYLASKSHILRLSRRPRELAPAEKMEMQVVNRLTAVSAAIDDHTVTTAKVLFAGDIANHEPEMAEQIGVRVFDLGNRRDWLLGNHQDVRWCLRCNVMKGQASIVFVDDLCGDFLIDDPLEDSFVGHELFPDSTPRKAL